jgi:hypothetical protein
MASEEDRDKTAFSAFGKQYRFRVSPFGARYLPSKFNKLMTAILTGTEHFLFYYFDDVIGCFQTPDELFDGLATVLQKLSLANLRVNFAKSNFCLTSLDKIKWLGTVIQGNKVHPDSAKIAAIMDMPVPHTRNALQRFLGAVNYHRRHISHLAEMQAPLNKLVSKLVPFQMTPELVQIFNQLKQMLSAAPALSLPDTSRPFIITTDASDIGVGGVLTQPPENPEDAETVVAYCSRTLSANEQNGSSCEKEILAILYAVSYFHFYIANVHFTLRSDSKSLVYLRHFKNLNSKIFRASLILDELSFDIQHMSATRSNVMGIADMISRAYGDAAPDPPRASYKALRSPVFEKLTAPPMMPPYAIPKEDFDALAATYLQDFLAKNPTVQDDLEPRQVNLVGDSEELAAILTCRQEHPRLNVNAQNAREILRISKIQPTLTPEIFRQAQQDDKVIGTIIKNMERNPHNHGDYNIIKGILCENRIQQNGLRRNVIHVPTILRQEVLRFYHGAPQGAHVGRKRLYGNLQYFYYWHGMAEDVKRYCRACPVCIYETPNTAPQVVYGRSNITKHRNELLNIDIVGPLPTSSDQMKYILTVQCDFSKYVLAFPLRRKSAELIVKTLLNHWIAPFGAPRLIRSDEGTDCDSSLMQYVCQALSVQKVRTPIYSPQANPIERWHATLGQAMRTWLTETQYKEWPTVVPLIAHSYNTRQITSCQSSRTTTQRSIAIATSSNYREHRESSGASPGTT